MWLWARRGVAVSAPWPPCPASGVAPRTPCRPLVQAGPRPVTAVRALAAGPPPLRGAVGSSRRVGQYRTSPSPARRDERAPEPVPRRLACDDRTVGSTPRRHATRHSTAATPPDGWRGDAGRRRAGRWWRSLATSSAPGRRPRSRRHSSARAHPSAIAGADPRRWTVPASAAARADGSSCNFSASWCSPCRAGSNLELVAFAYAHRAPTAAALAGVVFDDLEHHGAGVTSCGPRGRRGLP